MVYETTGKFQLFEGDVDNFDKMMEAVGVSAEKRQKGRTLKPIIEFSADGDKYKVTGSAEGIPERTKEFILDVEQEETTIDGRKVKSTYKREARGVMVQHEVQENGVLVVYHREIKGDQMFVKVTCGDLVANRVYKKI